MALKDVGFFKRHVEKIVLAVCALFLLIMASIYVFGSPYATSLAGNSQPRSPGEVEQQINQQAQRLRQRFDMTLIEMLGEDREPPQIPDISGAIASHLQQQTLEPVQFAVLSGMPMPGARFVPDTGARQRFYVPGPPAPTQPVAHADYAVLAPPFAPGWQNDRAYNAAIELVGNDRPRDFRYVSVEALFNMSELARRYEQEPRNPELRQLHSNWWTGMRAIAGVYLQRQQRDPATGQWTNTTYVRPLNQPLQYGFVGGEYVGWDEQLAREWVTWIKSSQQTVRQPGFVNIQNRQWAPPRDVRPAFSAEQHEQLRDIFDDMERTVELMRRLEDRANIPHDGDPPQQISGQRQELWNRIQELRADRETYKQQVRQVVQQARAAAASRRVSLPTASGDGTGEQRNDPMTNNGGPPGTDATVPPGPAAPGRTGDAGGEQDEQQPDRIVRVWAHDLTAEPGKTYRYRVVVSVLNPLFRRGGEQVPESQREEHYDRIAIGPNEQVLANAEWAGPVEVPPEHYFFFVEGSAASEQATTEIWRIYDGMWRFVAEGFGPGEPIMKQAELQLGNDDDTTRIAMNTDAILIDLMPIGGGAAAGQQTRTLYLDQSLGEIDSRIIEEDSRSLDRMRLQNERSMRLLMSQDDLAPADGERRPVGEREARAGQGPRP